MSGPVRLSIYEDGWTSGLQLSVEDDDGGYRIIGPKFNGSSKRRASRVLDDRDIAMIRRYLDQAEAALSAPPGVSGDGGEQR